MTITFYNHACFAIENEHSVLLCDPYLAGTAFNNGWDLIVEDVNVEFDLSKRNYIYFSHEHPDHFSVPFLTKIPQQDRANITIVYQKTKDQRVASFVKKLGFALQEVENEQSFYLSDDFFITVGQIPFYDSWACVQLNGMKIVNANDCILETPDRVEDIQRIVGECDVLFTQFSYANWVEGGSHCAIERHALAQEKLRRIEMQVDVLKPKFVVPFASMVRFCHVENDYMNDAINTPKMAVEFIQHQTRAQPFLMIPHESWSGSEQKDNEAAVEYWQRAYHQALQRPLIEVGASASSETLLEAYQDMIKRVKLKNNYLLIRLMSMAGLLPTLKMVCSDTQQTFQFNWHGGLTVTTGTQQGEADLVLSSESLLFLFKFDFGVDTLNVNARFDGVLRAKKSLIRTFSVLALNNTGRYLTFRSLAAMACDPSFVKQGLRTVGILSKTAK